MYSADRAADGPAWPGGSGWRPPPFPPGIMLRRLLHGGGVFWVVATVLGFLLWWPVGLFVLLFGFGRRIMGCGRYRRWAMAQAGEQGGRFMGGGHGCGRRGSGNRAFDEYRAETLRRMEQEQTEFATFLDRLRFARDKAEFDAFMNERARSAPPAPEAPPA